MIHIGEGWCILHSEPLGSFKNVIRVINAQNMTFSLIYVSNFFLICPFGPGNGFQYQILYFIYVLILLYLTTLLSTSFYVTSLIMNWKYCIRIRKMSLLYSVKPRNSHVNRVYISTWDLRNTNQGWWLMDCHVQYIFMLNLCVVHTKSWSVIKNAPCELKCSQ
jgi:hypothetical protein